VSLQDFFHILDEHDVPYVVLRWFDALPHVDPGEDVDLLVADDHLDFVHTLLLPRPMRRDSQAFDVYTAGGLPGSDFDGVPYYPPDFAEAVLAGAVRVRDVCRAPSPEHHYLSLAYHAVYHKGYASGLPHAADENSRVETGNAPEPNSPPADHDYAAVLSELAEQLGMRPSHTLDELDTLLADRGLRPPLDTLERLVPSNPWINDRFLAHLPAVDEVWRGLAVFVVRERADEHADRIACELDRHGFEILEIIRLSPAQRETARRRLRGGNWGRGPWQFSGGGPSCFIIGYDVAPQFETLPGNGGLINLRIPEAKEKVRQHLATGGGPLADCNPLHSSDNPRQALDYLEVLADPDVLTRLAAKARQLMAVCASPFPVVRFLAPDGPSRRARVALVDHPVHGRCVCKIYRPGAQRFFEREVRARKDLVDLPETPGLLEHGENWVLTPHYFDDGRHALRRLPFRQGIDDAVQLRPDASRQLARFAQRLHERGLFVLDLTTENLASDPAAGLKVLDLEFLQEYQELRPDLTSSWTFRGLPRHAGNGYDEPQDVPLTDRVGNQVFHPAITGMPVEVLLRPSRPGDDVGRCLTQLVWFTRLAVTGAYLVCRAPVARSRPGRVLKRLSLLVRERLTQGPLGQGHGPQQLPGQVGHGPEGP
jgi:hypothetical protein